MLSKCQQFARLHPPTWRRPSNLSLLSVSYSFVFSLLTVLRPPDVAQIEESVGQRLLDMEDKTKRVEQELESLKEQLRQYTAKSQITDSELQYLLYVSVLYESSLALFTPSFVSILNPLPGFCRESWRVWETLNTSFRLFRTRWMKTPLRSSHQQCESLISYPPRAGFGSRVLPLKIRTFFLASVAKCLLVLMVGIVSYTQRGWSGPALYEKRVLRSFVMIWCCIN